MPVHLRPGELDQPPPDLGRTESDEENSFLNDADLAVDHLPQPYRTIDKLLFKIFNNAWEEIESREAERIERTKHHKADCLYASDPIQVLSDSSTLCFSPDSEFVFASMFSGELAMFRKNDHLCICKLHPDGVEESSCFEHMFCVAIQPKVYLLCCIDDLGFAKLFINLRGRFYFVQTLNEQSEDGVKSNAFKLSVDEEGEFAGLALKQDKECWLNLFKLPKQQWKNEINETIKTYSKSLESGSYSEEEEVLDVEPLEVEFSRAFTVLRLDQPAPIEGASYASYKEALDNATCSFGIGSGEGHLFTENHIKLRIAAIRKLHATELAEVPEIVDVDYVPTWHYLKASMLQPNSCVNSHHESGSGSVAVLVWWNNSFHAHMYSLPQPKGAASSFKESSSRAEVVWPMCDLITASALSSCTHHIALGMRDGTVAVIDRNNCFPRAAVSVRRSLGVRDLRFLDATRVLVGMGDGGVVLLDCESQQCRDVTPKISNGDFELQLLTSLPPRGGVNYFVCASAYDRLQVFDVDGAAASAYDLVFPDSLEEAHERFYFSPDGRVIYAKNEEDGSICRVQLDHVRALDGVFEPQPPRVESSGGEAISFSEQMQALLTERTGRQQKRTNAFRERWFELAQEIQLAN